MSNEETDIKKDAEEKKPVGPPKSVFREYLESFTVTLIIRRFDPEVMARVAQLRSVLWDAVAELTSPSHSLVFTNYLPLGRPATVIDRHREVAQELGCSVNAARVRCHRALTRLEKQMADQP